MITPTSRKDPFLSLFSVFAVTKLPKVMSRRTDECFCMEQYAYRADDLDRFRFLPEDQPETDACAVMTLVPSQKESFAEWAIALSGSCTSTDIPALEKCLRERQYLLTLGQAERMVEITERYLQTFWKCENGWNIYFFVENGDLSVSVMHIFRYGVRNMRVLNTLHLGNSHPRHPKKFLFVPNLNTASPVF